MMTAEEFSKNLLDLDDRIRFAGVMEKSGHLYARHTKEGFEEYLKEKDQGISFSQTAHIVEMRKTFSSDLGDLKYIVYTYDKLKIFSFPLMDHIVVLSAEGFGECRKYYREDFRIYRYNGSKIIVISTV